MGGGLSQVEGHDGSAVGVVPHLDGPVLCKYTYNIAVHV